MRFLFAPHFLAVTILFLCGCGPKVFLAQNSGDRLRTIALLPPSYEADVAREKIDYIQDAFARKLSARGFKVIEGQALRKICPNGI